VRLVDILIASTHVQNFRYGHMQVALNMDGTEAEEGLNRRLVAAFL
jgi:F420-0:gamma-glutamyl ligase